MKRSRPRVARTLKAKPVSPARPGTVSGGIKIPPILFEGDKPELAPAAGLAPTASLRSSDTAARVAAGPRELPEAYGTGRLLVLARDPHCLYAHWDLTSAQLKQYESLSTDGSLMVRCHRDEAAGPVAGEIPTQAGARHVFLNVADAGARYVVELGYYGAERQWDDAGNKWHSAMLADSLSTSCVRSASREPLERSRLSSRLRRSGRPSSLVHLSDLR